MGQGQAFVFGESVKSRIVRKSGCQGLETFLTDQSHRTTLGGHSRKNRGLGRGKSLPDSLEQVPLLAASCIGERQE